MQRTPTITPPKPRDVACAKIARFLAVHVVDWIFRTCCAAACYVWFPRHDAYFGFGDGRRLYFCISAMSAHNVWAEAVASSCVVFVVLMCHDKYERRALVGPVRVLYGMMLITLPYCGGKFVMYIYCLVEYASGMCYRRIGSHHIQAFSVVFHVCKTLVHMHSMLLIVDCVSRFAHRAEMWALRDNAERGIGASPRQRTPRASGGLTPRRRE